MAVTGHAIGPGSCVFRGFRRESGLPSPAHPWRRRRHGTPLLREKLCCGHERGPGTVFAAITRLRTHLHLTPNMAPSWQAVYVMIPTVVN